MLKDDWDEFKKFFTRKEYRIVKREGHVREWYYVEYKFTWWPFWKESDFCWTEEDARKHVKTLMKKKKRGPDELIAHEVEK